MLVYSAAEGTRSGRPWADGAWRPADVSVADAAAMSAIALAGYAVSSSDVELVTGWLAGGAQTMRHAHVLTRDLAVVPEPAAVAGFRVHGIGTDQVARHAHRLGELNFAAYPREHPDHAHATVTSAVEEMRGIARGEILGPLLRVSQIAVSDHAVVGAALIVDRPGAAPDGGPWVLDIFRDPSSPMKGIGRGLLAAVLSAAKEAGLPSMTLVVSHTNATALALYLSLGFVDVEQSWTLALPS